MYLSTVQNRILYFWALYQNFRANGPIFLKVQTNDATNSPSLRPTAPSFIVDTPSVGHS
jgi:hypothetical protein